MNKQIYQLTIVAETTIIPAGALLAALILLLLQLLIIDPGGIRRW